MMLKFNFFTVALFVVFSHSAFANLITFSPNRKIKVSTFHQNGKPTIQLTETSSSKVKWTYRLKAGKEPTTALFSKDGSLLAVGFNQGGILLFNITTGRPIHFLRSPSAKAITSVVFVETETGLILESSSNETIAAWDIETENLLFTFEKK